MKFQLLRGAALASSAFFVTGCATAPGTNQNAFTKQIKETFASDDPCSNNARNIGVVSGAVLDTLLENALGGVRDGLRAA